MSHSLASVTSDDLAAVRAGSPGVRLGVILPVGAVEQHGAHLPVTTDTDIGVGAAAALAAALSATGRFRAWAAPAIPYGPVPGAGHTPGTAAVGFAELGSYLSAVAAGFAQSGTWDFLVLVNAHAHNHGRAIEASSGVYERFRVPVSVIHVYDYLHLAQEAGLVAGSHGGEFEIALHRYYTRLEPARRTVPTTPAPRPRPGSIYGLDLLPRSLGGIIAPEPPSIERALGAADVLGRRVDAAVARRVVEDLDTYFSRWHDERPPAEPHR